MSGEQKSGGGKSFHLIHLRLMVLTLTGILGGIGETVGNTLGGVTDTVGNTVGGVGKGVGDTLS